MQPETFVTASVVTASVSSALRRRERDESRPISVKHGLKPIAGTKLPVDRAEMPFKDRIQIVIRILRSQLKTSTNSTGATPLMIEVDRTKVEPCAKLKAGCSLPSMHSVKLLNEPALHRVKNGFQPVVRPEFLVDGVEMISQRWQCYSQLLCNLARVLCFGKQY